MKIRMFALLALPTLLLSGCDNLNRSLLFYTHTNVGIEVGVDPTQQSGKVLIGYKRAEGVVNPVYIPPEKKVEHDKDDTGKITKTTITYAGGKADDVYREEAYSVMAKIAGEANGRGATGQAGEFEAAGKIAQWFATGEAAKLLAKNEYAAAALTGSSETAKAISDAKLSDGLTSLGDTALSSELTTIYTRLRYWENNNGDTRAGKIADRLDTLSSDFHTNRVGYIQYTKSSSGYNSRQAAGPSTNFATLTNGWANSGSTMEVVDEILSINPGPYTLNGSSQALDANHKALLQMHRSLAESYRKSSDKALSQSDEVITAVQYYADKISGRK